MAKLEQAVSRTFATETPRVGPLSGVFAKLAEEHADARATLERLVASNDVELRRGLFPEVRDRLLAHEEAELMELFPLLRRDDRTRTLAEQHDRDAGELRLLLNAVSSVEPDDATWPETVSKLLTHFEQHSAEEEAQTFPLALDVLGADEAVRLEKVVSAARQRALEKLEELAGSRRA